MAGHGVAVSHVLALRLTEYDRLPSCWAPGELGTLRPDQSLFPAKGNNECGGEASSRYCGQVSHFH